MYYYYVFQKNQEEEYSMHGEISNVLSKDASCMKCIHSFVCLLNRCCFVLVPSIYSWVFFLFPCVYYLFFVSAPCFCILCFWAERKHHHMFFPSPYYASIFFFQCFLPFQSINLHSRNITDLFIR